MFGSAPISVFSVNALRSRCLCGLEFPVKATTETQRTQSIHREEFKLVHYLMFQFEDKNIAEVSDSIGSP